MKQLARTEEIKRGDVIAFIPRAEGSEFGTLAVRSAIPDWDRPVMIVCYYPINERAFYPNIQFHIGKEVTCCGNGRYRYYAGFGYNYFTLIKFGATRPCKAEEFDIPRPKTRVQTRWTNGRWEKYLKSKGWTPA